MYEESYNKEKELVMEDSDIVWQMGKYIKHHRIKQNKTQKDLSVDSGIKRETIARMENGSTFNIMTFIRLLRYLNVLEEFANMFNVPDYISPSLYMKMRGRAPQRIRHSKAETKTEKSTIKKPR